MMNPSAAVRAPSLSPPISPLPTVQLLLLSGMNFINSACYLVTLPMVPFMVLSFFPGMSEHEVGYYSGTLEGSFHAGALLGALFWGWMADFAGRRPSLLWGLAGTVISAIAFGASRSYGSALAWKFVWGLLNGNVGVTKTALSEVCDDSNSARAFSFMGVAAGFGRLIGPAIGGLLSEPAVKYPAYFDSGGLFGYFPFLLPCLVAALLTGALFVLSLFSLIETRGMDGGHSTVLAAVVRNNLQQGRELTPRQNQAEEADDHRDVDRLITSTRGTVSIDVSSSPDIKSCASAETVKLQPASSSLEPMKLGAIALNVVYSERPVLQSWFAMCCCRERTVIESLCLCGGTWLRDPPDAAHSSSRGDCGIFAYTTRLLLLLRDRGVGFATALYVVLSCVGLMSSELFPVYVLNDAAHGGFGWGSAEVGLLAMGCGPAMIAYQLLVYDRLVRWCGLMATARASLAVHAVAMAATPLCSAALHLPAPAGSAPLQWAVLAACFVVGNVSRVSAFTCTFVFVANAAAPADRSTVNGLGQGLASAVRALSPSLGTALFAWSLSPANMAAGWPWDFHLTWYAVSALSICALAVTYALPPWIERKRP